MKDLRSVRGVILCGAAVAFICGLSSCGPAKGTPAGNAPVQKGVAQKTVLPAKKEFAKGMGGLTVKVVNIKNMPSPVRIKAFIASDARSSMYRATFAANVTQELAAGTYDIEIDSVPQRIYKGIVVTAGKETVEDIGCLTGALTVKALNSKQKNAAYPVKVLHAGTRTIVASTAANRPLEIAPGVYDVEVGIMPLLVKKDVRVAVSKETAIDLGGMTGDLVVKVTDENNKEKRQTVRVKKAGTNEVVASGTSNRPLEIVQGIYDVEVAALPVQSKKGVEVKAFTESAVVFTVQAPAAKTPVAAKPAVPAQAPKK